MTKLRMAVVGVGSLGQHHAAKLSAFEDVDLVGVVDPGESQGRTVAERVGTDWFRDVDSLPADIHAVVVATPTRFHLDAATHFLTQGIPTFVEKPLASTLSDAEKLVRLADRHNCILQVGHIERFNPAFDAARELCGTPLYIRCQRVSPYTFRSTDIGVVHDLMIHDIDLVLDLTGQMPTSVEAFGAVGIGPHEDMAVARLKMPSGTFVDITSSRMCPAAERTMVIWGTEGCVEVDLQSRQVHHWAPKGQFASNPQLVHALIAATSDPRTLKDRVFGEWIEVQTITASSDDAMSLELRDFIDSVRSEGSPRVSGREGVAAMQVAEQVLSSLRLWSYQTSALAAQTKRAA
ncbi:MAG: Gfo/Idh/MocA family oxidoreductase [Planctomycetaceae bacterium]|nr:Gfo/Idh/MocA family oxidoreductase [Planctomycetaceae bacterium]